MFVDTPHTPDPGEQHRELRREAVLSNSRRWRLGAVVVAGAIVGISSILALVATFAATEAAEALPAQVSRYCIVAIPTPPSVDLDGSHAFLGIRFASHDGVVKIDSVLPNTPAEYLGLHAGDLVLAVDGTPIHSASELKGCIYRARPGTRPSILIERNGARTIVRPTLVRWPFDARVGA